MKKKRIKTSHKNEMKLYRLIKDYQTGDKTDVGRYEFIIKNGCTSLQVLLQTE